MLFVRWLNPMLVDYQTRFAMGENTSTVWVYQTDCLAVTEIGQDSLVKSVDVEVELRDVVSESNFCFIHSLLILVAANHLVKQLKCLQEGLLLFKIQ
jgi:hypothetical protein